MDSSKVAEDYITHHSNMDKDPESFVSHIEGWGLKRDPDMTVEENAQAFSKMIDPCLVDWVRSSRNRWMSPLEYSIWREFKARST